MTVNHTTFHGFSIHKNYIPLDSSAFVLKRKFSMSERGGVVMSKPVGDSVEGVEIVVVGSKFLF